MQQTEAGSADQVLRFIAVAPARRRDVEHGVVAVEAQDDVGRVVGQQPELPRRAGQAGLESAPPRRGGGHGEGGDGAGQQEYLQQQRVALDRTRVQRQGCGVRGREQGRHQADDQQPQGRAGRLGLVGQEQQSHEGDVAHMQLRLQEHPGGDRRKQGQQRQIADDRVPRQEPRDAGAVERQQRRGDDHQTQGVGQGPDGQGAQRAAARAQVEQADGGRGRQRRGAQGQDREADQVAIARQVQPLAGEPAQAGGADQDFQRIDQRQSGRRQ